MPKTGELSRLFGIDRTTLNYYVKKGMIRADQSESRYHSYSFTDILALSFVRYYRGMGFAAGEIRDLLSLDDKSQMLSRILEKQENLSEQIRELKLKQTFLENLRATMTFIMLNKGTPVKVNTGAYYFIRKSELEHDPVWLDLYKMSPCIEFAPRYNALSGQVEMPDLLMFSGISMKESWLTEYALTPPEGATYYPACEKYLVNWTISADHPEQALSDHVKGLFEDPPDGRPLAADFVLYMIPSYYQTPDACFDALCFFRPANEADPIRRSSESKSDT